MKCQILRVAGKELNFNQTRLLMNLLDMINLNNIRQKYITVKIFDTAVVLENFKTAGLSPPKTTAVRHSIRRNGNLLLVPILAPS